MPKSLLICGVAYELRFDPQDSGGLTDLESKVITVGTRAKKDTYNILLHEIGEAMFHERGLRYTRYSDGNDGVRFIMTHHEFENLVADVIAIIPQLKVLTSKL